jgi:hypothetical protein
VRSVAPAALVRQFPSEKSVQVGPGKDKDRQDLLSGYSEDTLLARLDSGIRPGGSTSGELQIYPLLKKPNAPFADMITVGRTDNNDVVLKDITVSRFHAFFRQRGDEWMVCDAGSKNGTLLRNAPLVPRKEQPLSSGDAVRLGDIATTFYTAHDLFDVLRNV